MDERRENKVCAQCFALGFATAFFLFLTIGILDARGFIHL